MSNHLNFGLVGLGRWGQKYLKTIQNLKGVKLSAVTCRKTQVNLLKNLDLKIYYDWKIMLENPNLDGIIIATQPEKHYEISKDFLTKKIPILVEKPFTTSKTQTDLLFQIAQKNKTLCCVGYIHLFSSSYLQLKKKIKKLNIPLNIYSQGLSYGPFRKNTPVLWDWGCHELSICLDIMGDQIINVKAKKIKEKKEINNAGIFELEILYKNGNSFKSIFGNISKNKKRDFTVSSENISFKIDGLDNNLYIYDNNVGDYLLDDLHTNSQKPLESMLIDFSDHIKGDKKNHYTLSLAKKINDILNQIQL